MTVRINRDQVLKEILSTLVEGWGFKVVVSALHDVGVSKERIDSSTTAQKAHVEYASAVKIVEKMEFVGERKTLMLKLAKDFDGGVAFPKLSDVRAFLVSHHRDSKDIKTRLQAFRNIMPILSEMSEKGLEKLISRSQHSGPAELEAISKAIRGAGEDLRGGKAASKESNRPDSLTNNLENSSATDIESAEGEGSKDSNKK